MVLPATRGIPDPLELPGAGEVVAVAERFFQSLLEQLVITLAVEVLQEPQETPEQAFPVVEAGAEEEIFLLRVGPVTQEMPGVRAVLGLEGLWAELVARALLGGIPRILGQEKMGLTEP